MKTQNSITSIPVGMIIPGPNDRTRFNLDELEALAANIAENGLIQPLPVRPVWRCPQCQETEADPFEHAHGTTIAHYILAEKYYEIIAGERRFRAMTTILHHDHVDCIIHNLGDEAASAMMLSENVSRADLDPVDEGMAYATRIERYDWSEQDCADRAGVSIMRVRFRLKLLTLRPELRDLVRSGQLPLGYAQTIADGHLDRNRQMIALARLRRNPRPTPGWMRNQVALLQQEQCQARMFETPLLSIQQVLAVQPSAPDDPPLPSKVIPPAKGDTYRQQLESLVQFWMNASRQWQAMGKPFKRQQCEAAAQALQGAISVTVIRDPA